MAVVSECLSICVQIYTNHADSRSSASLDHYSSSSLQWSLYC